MPVDRGLGQDLAAQLADFYRELETRLAVDIARHLRAGNPDAPGWAMEKLAAASVLRRNAEALLRRLDSRLGPRVEQLLVLAYARGSAEALREMQRLGRPHPQHGLLMRLLNRLVALATRNRRDERAEFEEALRAIPGAWAISRLTWSLVSQLRGTHLRILRWDLDAYREVVAKASVPVLAGVQTRPQAAQVAWETLLAQGITGFVDKSGRRWRLESYVEMATRSTVAQAAVQAHLDRLQSAGLHYVIVSDAPGECLLCRPWEGKVLAIASDPGSRVVQLEHAIRDGDLVDVHVAGTVAEAIVRGLMHPNCRHSLSVYLPGVTRVPEHTADPEGDKARQRLRHLERQVRYWKRVQAAALSNGQAAAAAAKVRAYQAQIREHLATTGLLRQPHREQIGTAI